MALIFLVLASCAQYNAYPEACVTVIETTEEAPRLVDDATCHRQPFGRGGTNPEPWGWP